MRATQFLVSSRSELRPNKVALVGKQKKVGSVGYQVDTGALSQVGNNIGLPHFTPRAGLQADEQASGTGTVNKVVSEKRCGGIAEDTAGSGWGIGPENLCRRLVAIKLKHQAADEQSVAMEDRSGDCRETGATARHGRLAPVNGAIGGIQRGD